MNVFKILPVAPVPASERAPWYDALFFTITGLSVFFTVLVFGLVLFLATKYRRGSSADRRKPLYHSTALELTLSIVPLVLGLGIFAWSTVGFINYRKMPENAMEIYVIGKQWMWHLQHMNGVRENNELHVPVDTPIKMTMISQDVIHSMYLPEFRAQYHVVPGRYTDMTFTPTKVGRYKMLCNMLCGTQHSEMVGFVYVMSKRDFAKWMENGGNRYVEEPMSLTALGEQVWKDKGCGNCHVGVDNVRGPSVFGIEGTRRPLADGTTVLADRDYLRESILMPWLRLTRNYETTMPAYKGQLTEEQVLGLLDYMNSVGRQGGQDRMMPYEPPVPQTRPVPTGPMNATDIANKRQSAGATQAEQGAANQ